VHKVTLFTWGAGESFEKQIGNLSIVHYSTGRANEYTKGNNIKSKKFIIDLFSFYGIQYLTFLTHKSPSIKFFRTRFKENFDLAIRVAFNSNKIPGYLNKDNNIPIIELALVSGLPHYVSNLNEWLRFIYGESKCARLFSKHIFDILEIFIQKLYISTLSSKNVIAISDYDYKEFSKYKSLKPHFIFPIYEFSNLPESNIGDSNTILFFSGNSFAARLASVFIQIAANRLPHLNFVVTGFIPTHNANTRYNNINFPGHLNDKDFKKMVANASIIILPLVYGTGIQTKMYEALAYGKPVITTSAIVSEFPSLINGKHVIIEDDPELFIEKIDYLYKNKKLREAMSKEALIYFNKFIEKNTTLKKYLDYINEVVSNTNGNNN
jgi:glycosyltransferase involved in cell wall biosynthesis